MAATRSTLQKNCTNWYATALPYSVRVAKRIESLCIDAGKRGITWILGLSSSPKSAAGTPQIVFKHSGRLGQYPRLT